MRSILRSKRGAHLVVGLMSGTSADGIDAVVAEISGNGRGLRVRLVAHLQQSFPRDLRRHILHVCLFGKVAEICELNFVLGEHFARAALAVIKQARLRPKDIDIIGSHGQTIHHLPRAQTPATLQIGEPSVIAERTGITTVADFRVRDMAAGGQGAPLVTYVDWAMHTDAKRPRILQNIGGIGNLTFLPPRATLAQVMAFDTGPGNMIIDAVVASLSSGRLTYDRNGQWAAKGKISQKLLKELMAHPYLRRLPPKTTGREEFGDPFVRDLLKSARQLRLPDADIVATVTAFTAASIADAYERFIFPKIKSVGRKQLQVILGGGGAKNGTLRRMLAERIAPAKPFDGMIWEILTQPKRPLRLQFLLTKPCRELASNVPSATGARRPVVLGKIIPG